MANQADKDEYVEVGGDIVGRWDGEGVVHFIPMSQRIFQNKTYKNKDSVLIIGKALAAVSCLDRDKNPVEAVAGDQIGVFYQHGMREILSLGECRIKMKRDPELDKDIGKGNPIKGYRIKKAASDVGKPLHVDYDYRLAGANQTASDQSRGAGRAAGDVDSVDDEDLPF